MSRHGSYSRKDVRTASGERLEPIPIQRWHCREHGVFSFLPAFLARWTRYLAEVAGTVVRAVAAQGKPELPLEVTGPDPRTALRWFRGLFDERLKRWLLQRMRGDPPQSQGAYEMIELVESVARWAEPDPMRWLVATLLTFALGLTALAGPGQGGELLQGIDTPAHWHRHREELLELFREHVYGRDPQARPQWNAQETTEPVFSGRGLRTLTRLELDLLIYRPAGRRGWVLRDRLSTWAPGPTPQGAPAYSRISKNGFPASPPPHDRAVLRARRQARRPLGVFPRRAIPDGRRHSGAQRHPVQPG